MKRNQWGGRRAGAGRPAGSKGRSTQAVEDLLASLDCDPIEGMALIATNSKKALGLSEDETIPIALRAKMYEALAPYIAAKNRAVEVTHADPAEGHTAVVVLEPELVAQMDRSAGITDGECERITRDGEQ